MDTDLQRSCGRQVDVNSQLVTELLQLVHHFGFRWRVTAEQGHLGESGVDVVSGGDVGK